MLLIKAYYAQWINIFDMHFSSIGSDRQLCFRNMWLLNDYFETWERGVREWGTQYDYGIGRGGNSPQALSTCYNGWGRTNEA
jgi:hypothetical protein